MCVCAKSAHTFLQLGATLSFECISYFSEAARFFFFFRFYFVRHCCTATLLLDLKQKKRVFPSTAGKTRLFWGGWGGCMYVCSPLLGPFSCKVFSDEAAARLNCVFVLLETERQQPRSGCLLFVLRREAGCDQTWRRREKFCPKRVIELW